MYKDADKQRDAVRHAVQKHRVLQGITLAKDGCDFQGITYLPTEGITFQDIVDILDKHGFKVVRA